MNLKYRPDIDGLRAIAVISVLLYHANIEISGTQLFEGGYIGVDIFFVISGYLITSILLKEIFATNTISIKLFYEKRIRRILPPLFIVMLSTFPLAWLYMMPGQFIDLSRSVIYSLSFISNLYFHFDGQEYGAQSGFFVPLLHTWSLSVEEQFYIFFPIFMIVSFKYFKKYLFYIFILGFVFSLFFAHWYSLQNPSLSFYSLPTRSWELLAGSILAYANINLKNKFNFEEKNLKILPLFGISLIIFSFFFFNKETLHPSFLTLAPVLGTSLIILFPLNNTSLYKILSCKLSTSIGLISYSLYLWHYPIFSFDRIAEISFENNLIKILLVIIIFTLSTITYFFIEKPARNRRYSFKSISIFLILLFILLMCLSGLTISKKGFKERLPEILKFDLVTEPWNQLKNKDNQICFGKINGCTFNDLSPKKIILIGDSHAATLMFDLKNKVVREGYQFNVFSVGGCFYYPEFYRAYAKTKKAFGDCKENYFKKIKQKLNQEKNSIVIFVGRIPLHLSYLYFDNKEGGLENEGNLKWKSVFMSSSEKYKSIQESFKTETLNIAKNNKVIFVYPIPEVGWHVPEKLKKKIKSKKGNFINLGEDDFVTTSFQVYKERTEKSFDFLDSIKDENIYRVYPHNIFCNTLIKNRCITHDKDAIYYYDDDHLSLKGASLINDLLLSKIKIINNN